MAIGFCVWAALLTTYTIGNRTVAAVAALLAMMALAAIAQAVLLTTRPSATPTGTPTASPTKVTVVACQHTVAPTWRLTRQPRPPTAAQLGPEDQPERVHAPVAFPAGTRHGRSRRVASPDPPRPRRPPSGIDFAARVEENSVRPEAVLVAAVFVIYLCWDGLQLKVQRTQKYLDVTCIQVRYDELNATGPGRTTYAIDNLTKRTVARGKVTLVFVIGLVVMGGAVWYLNPSDLASAVAIDVIYCLLLLLYRLVQERALRRVGPAKLLLPETSGASTADELQKFVRLKESGAITEDEFLAQKTRLLAS